MNPLLSDEVLRLRRVLNLTTTDIAFRRGIQPNQATELVSQAYLARLQGMAGLNQDGQCLEETFGYLAQAIDALKQAQRDDVPPTLPGSGEFRAVLDAKTDLAGGSSK